MESFRSFRFNVQQFDSHLASIMAKACILHCYSFPLRKRDDSAVATHMHTMNLEHSFEHLSITEDEAPPRRPDLVRLNAQREIMSCRDRPPSRRGNKLFDKTTTKQNKDDCCDETTLETVFSQAPKRFPVPHRVPSARSQDECEDMSLASMGAQELEFYWQPTTSNNNSTRSLASTTAGGSQHQRRRLQRHPTPPHLLRTLTLSSHHHHRPHNPVALSLRNRGLSRLSLLSRGLSRQSSIMTNDSGSTQWPPRPPSFYSSRSARTFASQDTL